MNETDFLAALHRRAVDRIPHAGIRAALEGNTWLEADVVAGWPAIRLCGTLPPHGHDAYTCTHWYGAGLAEVLKDMGKRGAMLSILTGGGGLVIPTKGEVAA